MKVIEVLDMVVLRTCIARREIIEDPGGQPYEWKAAYSLVDGSYISPRDADYFERKGIIPEAIKGNTVSSIGFCPREQKWYGWSHRGMCGFGVGSKVKKGDCAYMPIDDAIRFWADGEDDRIKRAEIDAADPLGDRDGIGVLVEVESKGRLRHTWWEPYPNKWGRGEWEAKTLEDAKQMAVDYARSVS